jgi:hypothetical protein
LYRFGLSDAGVVSDVSDVDDVVDIMVISVGTSPFLAGADLVVVVGLSP